MYICQRSIVVAVTKSLSLAAKYSEGEFIAGDIGKPPGKATVK